MSDLKPYIVFVAPPNLEKLKHIRVKQGAKVTVSIKVISGYAVVRTCG